MSKFHKKNEKELRNRKGPSEKELKDRLRYELPPKKKNKS